MPGSIAPGFHEGSRSEYLAHYIFTMLGTAVPVPHQEDTGIVLSQRMSATAHSQPPTTRYR